MPGKNDASGLEKYRFSKENPPTNRGKRKKLLEVRNLLKAFGKLKAPAELLNSDFVQHFVVEKGLKGTFNEVLVAQLYAIALNSKDPKNQLKAINMIINLPKTSVNHTPAGIQINFITPPLPNQEEPIDLSNDSFSVEPVKESED